jgi:hypothetical protein
MPEKIKCSALYKHLLEVYAAQSELDLKNRKVIFDFTTETKPLVKQVTYPNSQQFLIKNPDGRYRDGQR